MTYFHMHRLYSLAYVGGNVHASVFYWQVSGLNFLRTFSFTFISFLWIRNSKVKDRHGTVAKPYPEVPGILKSLRENGIVLGVASRTPEIEGDKSLVETLGWNKYFSYKEIYPGSKVTHFDKLSKNSGNRN